MHPAAVTNHHCIVYLGIGSPGVLPQTMGRFASVCQKEHTVWVGTLGVWMGGTFPFFSFSIPSRENRQSRHVMLRGTVGIYT